MNIKSLFSCFALLIFTQTGMSQDDNLDVAKETRKELPTKFRIPVTIAKYSNYPEGLITYTFGRSHTNYTKQFDENSKAESIVGMEVDINANAHLLKFGLTNTWHFEATIPTITGASVKLNDTESLKNSDEYALVRSSIKSSFAESLIEADVCENQAECVSMIDSGLSLPSDNSSIGYVAGTPISTYANAAAVNYFRDLEKDGPTGLGDITIGTNHATYRSKDLSATSVVNLIAPTGPYDVKEGELATGKGKYTLWLREQARFQAHTGITASAIGSVGQDLTKAKTGGISEQYDGLLSSATLGFDVDFGAYTPVLDFLAASVNYDYESYPRIAKSDGTYDPSSNELYRTVQIRLSGINYKIPVILDYLKYDSSSGKNTYKRNNDFIGMTIIHKL